MLVSVIVPNYNHSKYLAQRLNSIIEQSYQDLEIIILDDCSTDDSRGVIESYKENSKITHVIYNQTNSGSTFKQWEKGFSLARGELIWIAESDDYCERRFLETLVSQFDNNPELVLAYCTSNIVDTRGELCGYNDIAEGIPETLFDGSSFIKRYMLAYNSIWNASAVVFRKKIALEISKEYMQFVAAGDHLFWIKLAELGDVMHVSAKLNFFRQHNNKVTPQKVLQGITYKEEKKIFDYLDSKSYVSFIDSLYVRSSFLLRIKNGEFNSNEIKKELLTIWGYKWWMSSFILLSIRRLSLMAR